MGRRAASTSPSASSCRHCRPSGRLDAGTEAKVLAALVTVLGGGLLAVALWGVAYMVFLQRADAWARHEWEEIGLPPLRRVGGLRFWRYERVLEKE